MVSVIRGRDDVSSVLGEGESLQELESLLEKIGVDREAIKKQLSRLDKSVSPKPSVSQKPETQPVQVQLDSLEDEMVESGPLQDEEVEVPTRKQPGRQVCANIKESREQALKELPDGFCLYEAGSSKSKRLHRLGHRWMVPGVVYFVYSFKGPLLPQEHEYEEVCKRLQRSLLHTKITRQWLRHGSVHGHRLRSGCLLVRVVQSSISS